MQTLASFSHFTLHLDGGSAAWITAIATAGGTIIVAFAAVLAVGNLRDARRTRHGQLVTELARDWTNPVAVDAHKFHSTYPEAKLIGLIDKIFRPDPTAQPATPNELDDWSKLRFVPDLIEALGVLCDEKAITPDVIYKMWGGPILMTWPKWDEAVRKLREYSGEPDTYWHFENLSLEIQAISERRKKLRSTT